MKKSVYTIMLLALVLPMLTACTAKEAAKPVEEVSKEVKAKKISDSGSVTETAEFPGVLNASEEAKIIAKSNGTIKSMNMNPGKAVNLGDLLVKIDDNAKSNGAGLDNAQVKQASLGAAQAEASYRLARTNYENLLLTSAKDLNQIDISKNQALTGKSNLSVTTDEAIKSAELAYQTAKLASEQAKITLDNRQKISGQSAVDADTNAGVVADSAYNTCGSTLYNLNLVMDLNTPGTVSLSYKNNLGAQDPATYIKTKNSYADAKKKYDDFSTQSFSSNQDKLSAATALLKITRTAVDSAKATLDKTITSAELPQSSLTGTSLNSLQAQVAGYQSALVGLLSQANGANQALTGIDLSNTATIESLQKAYELAKQQEAMALQSLNNLKAGNKSALDNAGFGADAAVNQYDSMKIKLNSQLAVAKSQMDMAQIGYSNALVTLQSLVDSHNIISPISGKVTKKLVSVGDTVSIGQLLGTVSKDDKVKVTFYVDQDSLANIKPGQDATIKNNDDKELKGKITNITPSADFVTKRFMVEVIPDKADASFTLGSVVTVAMNLQKKATEKNAIIVPLTALEIGQNETTIIYVENEHAKKALVKIIKVDGEYAQITTDLSKDAEIVISGNKYVNEGDKLNIIQ